MALDLKKTVQVARKEAGLNLIKHAEKQGMQRSDLKSQVVGAIDVSGSMDDFFRKGVVSAIVTRVLALSLNVDDDGQVPVYAFDSGVHTLSQPVNAGNIDTYVDKYVRPHLGGSTNYAPVLEEIHRGLKPGDPVYIAFFTDGENYDHAEAEKAIRALSHNPVFIQFVGIYEGREPGFNFLRKLDNLSGRKIDNAGFCTFDMKTVTEEQLYNGMMNEYPSFIKKAQQMGMLPWRSVQNAPQQKKSWW